MLGWVYIPDDAEQVLFGSFLDTFGPIKGDIIKIKKKSKKPEFSCVSNIMTIVCFVSNYTGYVILSFSHLYGKMQG